jgi:N12 class adenine-specific DNA methylase
MNRIAGLPNSDSNRAFNMFLKTRYLLEQAGGRVVFATGTPISNTMAEMYTMLRYLAPDLLKERGVEHFDAWAGNFTEAVTSLELAPDGSGYRMHTRFAKFINLPELLTMFRTVADVQTADMLKLPRPMIATGKPLIVAAPASKPLKDFIKTLTERAERLRTQRIDPSQDNMLKITGDGPKGRPRHAPGGTLRRPVRRYEAEPRYRSHPRCLAGDRERSLHPACILRFVNAGPRTIQRIR